MDHENWRIVPSYPHLMVSDLGRVKRSDGSITLGSIGGQQYRYVRVGRGKMKGVHVLVADAFKGPRPASATLVRHLNGRRSDNRETNVAYGTELDNKADGRRLGEIVHGDSAPWAKLSSAIVARLREAYRSGESLRRLCRILNVPYPAAYRAVRGQTWKHVGEPSVAVLGNRICRIAACEKSAGRRSGICRGHMVALCNARRGGKVPEWYTPEMRPTNGGR